MQPRTTITSRRKSNRLHPSADLIRRYGLFLLVAASVLSACGDRQCCYHAYRSLPSDGWSREDTLTFEVEAADSLTSYRLALEVRNRNDYPYQNLPLFLCFTDSAGIPLRTDTLPLRLADPAGSWTGKGWSGLYQSAFPAGEIPIGCAGRYYIKIAYTLPDERLQGVNDVGVRLSAAK